MQAITLAHIPTKLYYNCNNLHLIILKANLSFAGKTNSALSSRLCETEYSDIFSLNR